eukprot:537607_1
MLKLLLVALLQITIGIEYDIGLACRYVEYCLVSYCIGLGGHGVPHWSCPACKKYFPAVNSNNVTVFKTGWLDYDIHAFVAYEPTMPEIIVTFEGTEPLSGADWLDDFEFHKIDYPLSTCNTTPRCQVHKGFFNTYNAIRIPLWQKILEYKQAWPNAPIHITGHSLGSSLGTHCAIDGIINHNQTSYDYIYTFGTPRVGDPNFASFYEKHIPNHWRVTHRKDPVAQLPSEWMQHGYRHIFTEVYYPTDPNGTYKICDGSGEDPTCRDQYGMDVIDLYDHLDYLGFDFTTN